MASQRQCQLSREREECIIELAELIGEENQAVGGTDLDAILAEQSIEVQFADFSEPFDGLIVNKNGRFSIFCNRAAGNTERSSRARFTIAHELGHYFIDEHRQLLGQNLMPSPGERARESILIEREADLFASRLLLPGNSWRRALKGAKPGLAGVIQLAASFTASINCAAIRFLSADVVSCCLAYWSWDGKLRWKWFSRSLWNAGLRSIKLQPVQGGATSRVLSRGRAGPSEVEATAATVRYLFRGADGSYSDVVFHEEAVGLGEYGVLSLYRSAKPEMLEPIAAVLERRFDR